MAPRDPDEGPLGAYAVVEMIGGGDDDWLEIYRADALDYVAALDDLEQLLQIADEPRARWLAVPPVRDRYRAGEVRAIEAVAADERAPAGRRVVAMIAMVDGGARMSDESLVELVAGARDPEIRMAVLTMLGRSTSAKARRAVLRHLSSDGNERVRQSAALAAVRQRNVQAVPTLVELTDSRADNRIYIGALGALGSPAAAEALIDRLRVALDERPNSDELYRLQHAVGTALPIRFAEAGAPMLTHERSRTEIVDGAGHFLQLEQPEVVNGLLVDFLTA